MILEIVVELESLATSPTLIRAVPVHSEMLGQVWGMTIGFVTVGADVPSDLLREGLCVLLDVHF